MQTLDTKRFPNDFLWGVASASYQIEGGVNAWGRGSTIWDTYAHTSGRVYENQNADVACDHYHRWQDDLDLMRELGIKSYRFSIAWSRIFPSGFGKIEPKGLEFYDKLLDGILERGIVPMATLYHWDLPQELEDRGGWAERETAYRFADYAEVVLKKLGDRLPLINTVNEPYCVCFNGYFNGGQAPGKKNIRLAHHAAANYMLAHGLAMQRIRALAPKAEAGAVMNTTLALPSTDTPENREAARLLMEWENGIFLDPIYKGKFPESLYKYAPETMPAVSGEEFKVMTTPTDFFGLNYYWPTFVEFDADKKCPAAGLALDGKPGDAKGFPIRMVEPPAGKRTSVDWQWCIIPGALTELLCKLKNDYNIEKFYITENGSSFEDKVVDNRVDDPRVNDPDRQEFLVDHLNAVADAIDKGVNVKGYYYWSFTDNFEWTYGFRPRFGLVYTDYKTQARIVKDSGFLYKKIIEDFSRCNL